MGIKISELQEKTTANDTDVIPVVDEGTKKITKANFLKEILAKITGVQLFSNESGTTSNITLSDAITNYTEFKVKYIGVNGEPYSTGKLSTNNLSRIHLNTGFLGNCSNGTGGLITGCMRISISNTTVSVVSNRKYEKPYNSGASGGVYEDSSPVKITEIIGYK